MFELRKKVTKEVALPPGTLVHVGEQKMEKTRIRIMDYDDDELREREVDNIEECFPFRDMESSTWINIDGLHDIALIESLGQHFGIHPLVLEDIVNTAHRPKMEDFGDYLFVVLKMLFYDDDTNDILVEQVSVILGRNFVISFQEQAGDVFDPVRERIRSGKIRLRKRKADHIAFALIDAIVDNYFVVFEKLGDAIEKFEEVLLTDPPENTPQIIINMRRRVVSLQRIVRPLSEAIQNLHSSESELLADTTYLYLKDVHDHNIHLNDTVESYKDRITGMLDTYHTAVSNRMNEVMKVLTIIATVFIPLTFVAGIYGMNFERMPELSWKWAYPVGFWSTIVALGALMFYFFKRKKWL